MAAAQQRDLRILSQATLAQLDVSPAETADRIELLLRDPQTHSTPKSSIHPGTGRLFMSTLASSDGDGYMAVKALGMNNRNTEATLPAIGALVTLFDAKTGLPLAVMEGGWITEQRTAALTLVAARRLAPRNSRTLALLGAGVQARGHLRALATCFPLKQVRVYGRGEPNIDRVLTEARALGIEARAATTADAAIDSADIVVSSIPESENLSPVIDATALKPGSFTSLVDLGRAVVPKTLSAFDLIVVDDFDQEKSMPRPMIDPGLMSMDLRALIDDDTSRTGRTAFLFRGIAIADLALASLCYEKARTRDAGESVSL